MTEAKPTYGDGFAAGLAAGIELASQTSTPSLQYVEIDLPKQDESIDIFTDLISAPPKPSSSYVEFQGPPPITVHGLWRTIGARRMNDRWFARLVFEGHFSSAYHSIDEPAGVVLLPLDGKP